MNQSDNLTETIKAPNSFLHLQHKSIFLAGTIDNGKSDNWQEDVSQELVNCYDVINPRRDDWNENLTQSIDCAEFYRQVNWELDGLNWAETVLFYFAPNSQSPISLLELGIMAEQHKANYFTKNVVVCCPKDYWKRGNVEIICERYGIMLFENLEDSCDFLKKLVD